MPGKITVLSEAERLHRLGWAIHWCHPKSKKPIGKKWTHGPRLEWDALVKLHKPGNNLGVRLGEPSRMSGDLFLAVIDFDLKSDEDRHQDEMLAKLNALFPKLVDEAPLVASGRSNGSGHIYVRTEVPAAPSRLAQSSDEVEVKMPSVKPSKKEISKLSAEKIAQGYRLRPAWEISLMGTGQQVVLPPSIHPDSAKPYTWIRPITDVLSIPVVDAPEAKGSSLKTRQVLKDFEPLDVDLGMVEVSPKIVAMLETGEDEETGSTDKSAIAFKVTIALIHAGLSDREILSILTDRERFELGSIGFIHRKTEDRQSAAAWVLDYCVRKAREEHDLAREFDSELTLSAKDEAKIAVADAMQDEFSWLSTLDRNKQTNAVLNTTRNIRLILQNAVGKLVFQYNEFSNRTVYGINAPWNGKRAGMEVADIDAINVQSWLSDSWGFEPAKVKVIDAIEQVASENRFHPVRQYLEKLTWDGKPRIDSWLKDYLGCEAAEPYLSAVSRKVLCAMVARVFIPGIKFDHVLVLEGAQGIGKSTVANILGGEWFADAKLDLRDKDSVQTMFGRWVVELGELASLKFVDLETMKAFISRRIDRIRVSFGRLAQDYPRQCIFIGTTNAEEYLKDPSGERRFWPVRCEAEKFDFAGLRAIRDQLFAEAMFTWRDCGETLYLDENETAASRIEQEKRSEQDVWAEIFREFFDKPKEGEEGKNWSILKVRDIFAEFGPMPKKDPSYGDQKRATEALKLLGYTRRLFRAGKLVERKWVSPDVPLPTIFKPKS